MDASLSPMAQTPTSPADYGQFALGRKPRKRTRRACDKCNTSRTRCNGDHPCGRCQEYGYDCHYKRQAKKRGRVPLKEKKRRESQPDQQHERASSSPSSTNGENISQQEEDDRPHENTTMQDFSVILDAAQSISAAANQEQQQQARGRDTTAATAAAAAAPMTFGPTPRMDDFDNNNPPPLDHPTNSSGLQHSDLCRGLPRLMGGYPLAGRSSQDSSFSPSGGQNPFFGTPNPTLNFGLSNPEEVDRPSPNSTRSECRYRCLEPLLPFIGQRFPVSVACDLFDVYLLDPGASLWRFSSPFILTRVFRRKSLLGPNPRPTSPALLATMLWCCAQTADISVLLVPGSRSKLTNALYELATYLISRRDPDRWRRIHGGLQVEYDRDSGDLFPETTSSNEPAGTIDDVLTFLLLCVGVSAGDFKSDCFKWWCKAKRLAFALRLDRQDASGPGYYGDGGAPPLSLAELEAQEERRRVFWLLYALDRHLALSYNRILHIPDSICDVYAPLPEYIWENLDDIHNLPPRTLGPPVTVTGTGFFEYFLPLMVILGDIIEVHHGQYHPRLGTLDKKYAEGAIAELIAGCEASVERLARRHRLDPGGSGVVSQAPMRISTIVTGPLDHLSDVAAAQQHQPQQPPQQHQQPTSTSDQLDVRLVVAYSTFILHVLHVLFYGKWDAISMLDNEDDWITTPRFAECASHAIEASEAVADILRLDPELTFMPYLFGIYLLHGSFILLLFADRMPQLGQNQSVEQACETIIRAHEVCVVTLSTEFQRNFRRVLRSTLYNVRGGSPRSRGEHRLARRQVLSLYRWTRGAKGLGI